MHFFSYSLAMLLTLTLFTACSGGGGGSSKTNESAPGITLPADPATIAPQNDPTQATDFTDSTAFIYSSDTPIQKELNTTVIDENNVSIVKGTVLDKDGFALSGVKVTVLNHPEYGYTMSRDDGKYDMAVNGGTSLTMEYKKEGYMSLQRTTDIPRQDFSVFDDIVMTPFSQKVTTIDLETQTTPFSVVQGDRTNDARGERQATMLFPKNTTTQVVMPDGSTKSLKGPLHVRATEYTTGDKGLQAMPAALPEGVAYTYCVEFSVDEAQSLGASSVSFSKPLINYVENFVGFAVGSDVPSYYYDLKEAKWIKNENGKVIKIISVTNNKADVDIDGDGVADDTNSFGIDDDERARLASLYQAGTELWRVKVSHFTPIDHNWPTPPPPDDNNPPEQNDDNHRDTNDGCQTSGSIIECQKQTLGENIPITGTLLSLDYRSNHTAGDVRNRSIIIPLTKDKWSIKLEEIQVEISVAGQTFKTSFEEFTPYMTYEYVWNGKDAYDRNVYGAQAIHVKVSHI